MDGFSLDRAASEQVSTLGVALMTHVESFGQTMAEAIRQRVDFYAHEPKVPAADLADSCTDNLRYVLASLAGSTALDLTVAAATGRHRAEAGVPVSALMAAYRVGFTHIMELLLTEGRRADAQTETLLQATAHAVVAHDTFTQCAAAAHAEVMREQARRDEARRVALVDGLISGRVSDRATLWGYADALGFPNTGPYLAIAAVVHTVGESSLPDVEHALGNHGMPSAWILRQEYEVGIVAIGSATRLDALTRVLDGCAITRVGVSPVYADLDGTPDAVTLAKAATAGAPSDSRVTHFIDEPLAVAALGAPDVMKRIGQRIFADLDRLPAGDRATLITTLAAWVDAGGSTARAAEQLYLHPNTVRQRLNRLSQITGHSLTEPRSIAELCLALEVDRRLQP